MCSLLTVLVIIALAAHGTEDSIGSPWVTMGAVLTSAGYFLLGVGRVMWLLVNDPTQPLEDGLRGVRARP